MEATFASVTEPPNVNLTGQVGLIETYSAKTLGFTKLLFSVSGSFAYDARLVPQLEKQEGMFGYDTLRPYAVLYGIYPAIAFGLTDYLDLSVMQPFFTDVIEGSLPSGGAGDLSFALKCRLPHSKTRWIEGALHSQFSIANGNGKKGFLARHGYYVPQQPGDISAAEIRSPAFFTAGKPTWSFTALGTAGKRRLFLHANLGACFTFDKKLDNAVTGGVGVEWYPVKAVGLFTECYAEPRWRHLADGFIFNEDPVHLSPGVTFHTPGGTTLSLGGSFSLASNTAVFYRLERDGLPMAVSARTEPKWRIFVRLGWNGFLVDRDMDNDLLRDRDDACPDAREDIDGFDDGDGCPDPDNDNDDIVDSLDKCPNVPEDNDGFEDGDGCPDPDNDNDDIVDSLDKCPNVPEDNDGFEDADGCPDHDNDGDGVPDTLDKCVGTAEDADGFEDGDGCPDIDNDNDAVPDSIDKCPDSAGVPEEKGCPEPPAKAKKIQYGRLILSGVQFEGGSADLTSGSAENIDRVYQSLAEWPEVKLEIRAHTDNSAPEKQNLDLSKKRAEVVRDYLIQKGVAPSRLTAVGKGSTEPIADNTSVQGRRLNSRIEIHRID
ncbi:MAG: OmpA family protein [Chitinispirillaceae bacterium]|nr:OmpA family protein [Chitinispirillaceae bacterium]